MDIAQFLLQALKKGIDGCEERKVKQGVVDNLRSTMFLAQRIRRASEPRTIGFFGAQKRGKSSLINFLLGCDLMPTGPIPMSSVVIRASQNSEMADNLYEIDILNSNGSRDSCRDVTLDVAQLLLREYGSRKGKQSEDVDTIEVKAKFPNSKILGEGGVLVDTPGAEVAFGMDDPSSSTGALAENQDDAKRALDILEKMHLVIFVERADYMQSANSKKFFCEHLKPMRPLSVVNFKDVYEGSSSQTASSPEVVEARKQSEMQGRMLQTFGVNPGRILCVSSKEARDGRTNNDDGLLKRSHLPELEQRIVQEVSDLSSDQGLLICLQEIKKSLSQIEEATPEVVREVRARMTTPLHRFVQEAKNAEIAKAARGLLNT